MGKQKKKLILWALLIVCVLCGCKNNGAANTSESPAAPSLGATNAIGMKTLAEDVVIGDTLVYENFAEVKLYSFAFEEAIKPTAPAQFYTSYKVHEAGNVYAHLTIEVYNNYVEGMTADDFFSLILEDNGNHKNYTGFAVVEVNNGSDLALGKEHLIPPLTRATVHLLTEVPKSVTTSGVPYKLQLQFNESIYRINPDKIGEKTYKLGDWAADVTHDGSLLTNVEQHGLGESVQNGEDTYTVKSIVFENTVRPPNAAGNHINFELIEEGQTYAHVVVEYKNGGVSKSAAEIAPTSLYYEYYYSYIGDCVIEEPGGKNFTYPDLVDVGAGETVMLHYMIPVPTEVQANANKVSLAIEIDGGGYILYEAK